MGIIKMWTDISVQHAGLTQAKVDTLALKPSTIGTLSQLSLRSTLPKLCRSFWGTISDQINRLDRLVLVHDRLIVVEIASRDPHYLCAYSPAQSVKSPRMECKKGKEIDEWGTMRNWVPVA